LRKHPNAQNTLSQPPNVEFFSISLKEVLKYSIICIDYLCFALNVQMDIEDLVYRTGYDGKPKKKRNKQLNSYTNAQGESVLAKNFAAAVKAELDVQDAENNTTKCLRKDYKLNARVTDKKGHSKNHLQNYNSSRLGETLKIEPGGVVNSSITQDQVKMFFKDQPLLGEFVMSQEDALREFKSNDGNDDEDENRNDDASTIDTRSETSTSPTTTTSLVRGSKKIIGSNIFHQLDYLNRALTLDTQKSTKTSSPSRFSLSFSPPKIETTTTTTKIVTGKTRQRRNSKMTSQQETDWHDSIQESLEHMFLIQAKLEAEKEGKKTMLTRVGNLFGFGNNGTEYGRSNDTSSQKKVSTHNHFVANAKKAQAQSQSASRERKIQIENGNPGGKRKNGKNKQLIEDFKKDAYVNRASVSISNPSKNNSDVNKIRSFTDMFSLPNLFSGSKS
jgi:hypothetical protein